MEYVLSIVATIISLVAIVMQRMSLHDQAYEKFMRIWLDMDQLFVDHPEMHKFFYKDQDGKYAEISKAMDEYPLAVCIAEKFKDIFQYTFPFEKYLTAQDRDSYIKYKKMIGNSPVIRLFNADFTWSEHELWNGRTRKRKKMHS